MADPNTTLNNLYDIKCFELAEHFLSRDASDDEKDALAQVVQQAVEDHLRDMED